MWCPLVGMVGALQLVSEPNPDECGVKRAHTIGGDGLGVQRGRCDLFVEAGDSTPEELANATQVQGDYLPIVREKPTMELVKLTSEMKSFKAYDKIRLERTNKRHAGARAKRASEAEKEEKK
ncbi:hypothetical protein ISN45_Aa06g030530 [Arabidopsis thaliana x Arabidopsis arenosa]|uniref:Uncharacterized protein n=1 Tax=Arabidopsis thaliana x Arabidopsis arenosa TaxID=1240361 RepID=A0A8T1Z0Z6_9BRAS|nr:hypothetical protein ISN45_Aa06g030530 [Arabidopsis thaliana x Arabidopsis arenosa]